MSAPSQTPFFSSSSLFVPASLLTLLLLQSLRRLRGNSVVELGARDGILVCMILCGGGGDVMGELREVLGS